MKALFSTLPRVCYSLLFIIVMCWIFHVEGGLGFVEDNLFGWHAFLMVVAFPILLTEAMLVWDSSSPFANKRIAHLLLHIGTAIFGLLAMLAIVYYKHVGLSRIFPMFTLFSPHSWMGMLVCCCWLLQFFFGLASRVMSVSPRMKAASSRIHKFFGKAIYVTSLATCAMGFQDMQSSDLAGADLDQVSTMAYNPFSTAAQLACAGCFMLFFLGVSTFAVGEVNHLFRKGKQSAGDSAASLEELTPES